MDFVGDRRVLVRAVADAVVEVTRMAENGISISNIVTEVQSLRDEYLNASAFPILSSESVEVAAVLRRILRKKAQAHWTLANSQEQQGNRDAALQYYRISVLLDGAADALSGLLPTSIPSRTNLDKSAAARLLSITVLNKQISGSPSGADLLNASVLSKSVATGAPVSASVLADGQAVKLGSGSGLLGGLTGGTTAGSTGGLLSGVTSTVSGLTGGLTSGTTAGSTDGLLSGVTSTVSGLTGGLTNGTTAGKTGGLLSGVAGAVSGLTGGLTSGQPRVDSVGW